MSTDILTVPAEPKTLSEMARKIGHAKGVFDTIRVDYQPQTTAIAILEEVRYAAMGRPPGAPCGGAMLVAPTGCGKTKTVELLKKAASHEAEDGTTPILHIEIDQAGTTDSLPTSILTSLGAARPNAGTEKVRWPRAIAELRRANVKLIAIDEFNRAARRPTMSRPICAAIRQHIMDAGIAPVVFVGSEAAGSVLAQTPELMARLEDEIDLRPLDWNAGGDLDLFLHFVNDMDTAMVEHGLLACKSDLAEMSIARGLWEASTGHIRLICKILRHAMGSALRDGRGAIHRSDLADAVDAYCIPRNFCDHNPFA